MEMISGSLDDTGNKRAQLCGLYDDMCIWCTLCG